MWRKLLTVLACVLLVSVTAAADRPVTFVVHGSTEIIAAYEELFRRFTEETGIEVEIMVSGAQQAKWGASSGPCGRQQLSRHRLGREH